MINMIKALSNTEKNWRIEYENRNITPKQYNNKKIKTEKLIKCQKNVR